MPLQRSRLIGSATRLTAARMGLAALATGGVLTLMSSAVAARFSDPVRNLRPEEPCAAPEVQSPIHYILPTASPADPAGVSPEALLQEFLDRHTSLNYPAAAESALRLINATPDRPSGYYNLACAMARMQRIDEAIDALQQAMEHGWRDTTHMRLDADLAAVRGDSRYQQIVAAMRSRAEAERITPAPPRTDPWQAIAADLARDVPATLKDHHVPGASIALISDGQVVWTSAFGVRDARDAESALAVDDPFRLRAPLHLLAIAACGELERDQKINLAALIQDAVVQYAMTPADPPRRSTADRPLVRPAVTRTGGNGERGGPPIDAGTEPDAALSVARPRSYSRGSVYGVLRLAVEMASSDTFAGYCETALLRPMDLHQTGFAIGERASRVVLGHSYLGTPLRPGVGRDEFAEDGSLYITAGDLGRLITRTMRGAGDEDDGSIFLGDLPGDCHGSHADRGASGEKTSPAAAGETVATPSNGASVTPASERSASSPNVHAAAHKVNGAAGAIEMVTRVDAELPGGLGLALQRIDDADGSHMELVESAGGLVCLARWNPQTGRGIVILCNSATGRPAAERIAHMALGGQ